MFNTEPMLLSFRYHLRATVYLSAMLVDATTQTESIPTTSSACPRPLRKHVAQGRAFTRAYGFKLHSECINRWSRKQHDKIWPGQLDKMSAKKVRETLRDIRPATLSSIPRRVYAAIPTIPRLQRNIALVDLMAGTFLFVFKDNSSHAALHAPVDLADIERAKEMLGVDPNEPVRWYKVKPLS